METRLKIPRSYSPTGLFTIFYGVDITNTTVISSNLTKYSY